MWYVFYLQIFKGNINTYIAELREVDPPIIARNVRFIPYSEHPKTVCMRIEVYGCDWKGTSAIVQGNSLVDGPSNNKKTARQNIIKYYF